MFRNPNPSGEGLVAFNQFLHNKQALAELVHGTVHCHLVPRPKHGLLKIASIAIDKKVSHPDVRSITLFHVSQLLKVTFCFQNKLFHVTHINTLHCLQSSSSFQLTTIHSHKSHPFFCSTAQLLLDSPSHPSLPLSCTYPSVPLRGF